MKVNKIWGWDRLLFGSFFFGDDGCEEIFGDIICSICWKRWDDEGDLARDEGVIL